MSWGVVEEEEAWALEAGKGGRYMDGATQLEKGSVVVTAYLSSFADASHGPNPTVK